MRNLIMLSLFLLGSFHLICFAQEESVMIAVTNPAKFSRHSETISINWKEVSRHFPKDVKSVTVRDESTGREILSQLFDLNLDGVPDLLLFQSDFTPKQTKSFRVIGSQEAAKEGTSLVDARYVEPRQDVAWENDRIAYRMYGPALAAEVNNGIDVWTKRVRYLIVKKWYEGEEQTPKIIYHVDHGEGADFFDVGRSLGCGGLGIFYHKKIYQPGVFSSYKIISTGHIRACFELYYDNWNIDGKKLKETKRITLDAGQNLNRVESIFQGPPKNESLQVACGLVKRSNTKPYVNKANDWISLWGQINDSLPNGYLGTGIVFRPKTLMETTEDSAQYLMVAKTKIGSPFLYYAGAGWTRSGDFASVEDWNQYLASWSQAIRQPLKIIVSATTGKKK